jgi:DNA polymerase III epsilon subunit-like protein
MMQRPSPPPLTGSADELGMLSNGNFATFHQLLNKSGYVTLDYETTGLDAGNRPVQIAAVKIRDGKETDWLNVYMNPQEPLGSWSRTNLRGPTGTPLTDNWLAKQPSIASVHARVIDFIGDHIVVAQHLPFDADVLERSLHECGIDWEMTGGIDTKAFFAAAVPPGPLAPASYRLADLTAFFGVDLGDNHHDAIHDAIAAHEVLQRGLVYATDHGDPRVLDGRIQRANYMAALRGYLWDARIAAGDLSLR